MIGEKIGSVIISEQGELAVNIIGKDSAGDTEMWETQQDLLIIINNVTNITHPTAHEKNFFHESGQGIHSTSELRVLSFVTRQLEDLSYNLFLRACTSICTLRQHRIQMLKFIMYYGNSMFVARMLPNTTSVAAHDAGQLLAVTKCTTTKHYLLDRRSTCHQNIPIT